MDAFITYTQAKLYEPKGDSDWYVYFSYKDPGTGNQKRFIRKLGINRLKSAAGKRRYGKQVVQEINSLLKEGWNPFGDSKETYIPLKDTIKSFIEMKKTTMRRRSWQSYEYSANILFAWLEKQKLGYIFPRDFDQMMCRRFCDYLLTEKKFKGITFNSHKSFLSNFWNMMMERDLVEKNPFKKIANQAESAGRHVAFPDELRKKIEDHLILTNYRLYLFSQFIYYCYLRPIEILRLKIENIDDTRILIYGSQSKNKKQESVVIPDAFLPLVQSMKLRDYPKDHFIFGRGMMPSSIPLGRNRVSAQFKKIKEDLKLGPDYTLYGFKHSGNVNAYLAGIDIYSIMRQNRHHSIEQTMTYLRQLGVSKNIEFSTLMK